MKLLLSACAIISTIALVFIAAAAARQHPVRTDPLLSVATYSSAIVETIAENDPSFRDRFLTRLNGVK